MTWRAWPVVLMASLIPHLSCVDAAASGEHQQKSERSSKDIYGHTYKRQTNLFRDSDRNGVINLYQQQDRKPKAPRGKVSRPKKHRR